MLQLLAAMRDIDQDMVERLSKFVGTTPDIWNEMLATYGHAAFCSTACSYCVT
jgi:plasmid maintenance system antidote protein VapI